MKMWPILLDMTKEESMQSLRNLELEAYAHLVSALRAQGPLNPDKRKLLKDTSLVLNITQDRHKAEIRRAINDEKLNTIAYHVTGLNESIEDWAQEGRRTVPLVPRMAPQTAYSAIADDVADGASQTNKQLPPPACTERKRSTLVPSQMMPETSKTVPFRVPDLPKVEDSKKRKLHICTENSSLAQHLLGPSKISRTQQIYRQRTKAIMKDQQSKLKPMPSKLSYPSHPQPLINGPKPPQHQSSNEENMDQIPSNEINNYTLQKSTSESLPSNENQAPLPQRPKLIGPPKPPTPNVTYKTISTATTAGPSTSDSQKMKMCTGTVGIRKPVKPTPLAQKLIVVSNAQTIQSSSILQKTLSIPIVKNLSMKNFEKFKIVTTSSPQLATAANNLNSFKHKVVTVKTNPTTKKVIPLSQLLGTKGGIKVLPIGGKIVGKSITTTASQPLYIVNTLGTQKTVVANQHQQQQQQSSQQFQPQQQQQSQQHPQPSTVQQQQQQLQPVPQQQQESENLQNKENGKSSVLGDILKASGVTADDFDAQIEEFHIPNNNHIANSENEIHEQVEEDSSSIIEKDKSAQNFIIVHDGEYEDSSTNVVNSEAMDTTPISHQEIVLKNTEISNLSSDSNGN